MKTLCILGRQPALGLAELESLYGAEHLRPLDGAALLDIDNSQLDWQRLGGSLKIARVLTELPYTDWRQLSKYLLEQIPLHLKHAPPGKFTLGLSAYNLSVTPAEINRTALSIKKVAKTQRSMRVVPNKTTELNSAQVLHNKLTSLGAWELLLVGNGSRTWLAQTMFVQDIDAYAARDQARPKRDARVGMLPPKLAQIIINLATGHLASKRVGLDAGQGAGEQRTEAYEKGTSKEQSQPATLASAKSASGVDGSASKQAGAANLVLLDPFCGTGVILQEALLNGFNAYGSDLEPRMIDYTKTNLEWLMKQQARSWGTVKLQTADATAHQWTEKFGSLASEAYLGRPFTEQPDPDIMKQNVSDVNVITKKFLKNLHGQIPAGFRLCLALPAWKDKNGFQHLPVLDQLTGIGYNRMALKHVSFDELIYARQGQFVGRELVILQKL